MLLHDLAQRLGATLERGPAAGNLDVTRVMTLEDADAQSLSFITNPKYLDRLPATRAAAVLCDRRTLELHGEAFPCPALVVENAYLAFANAVSILHPVARPAPGVHPLAFVHPEAQLGPDVTIMPLAYVGRARIGARTVIHPHVHVGDDVEIGEDCMLHPHVVVMRGTRMGARVIMQPSSIAGSDGFGFAQDDQGRFTKILQIGNVVIADDVEIGACSCIDRAALGSTQLRKGVKLDNLVQIAHNVILDENVAMAGHTAVGGSSKLGKGVMVGGCSGVAGHLTVKDGAMLLGGSFLMHDMEAGDQFAGIPAQPRMKWAKQAVHQRNLDEYARTLKRLEKRVAELEAKLANAEVKR